MTMFTALLLLALFAQTPSSPPRRDGIPVTLTGCVQQTGDANIFLLAVPGIRPPVGIGNAGRANPPAGAATAGQRAGPGPGNDVSGRGTEESPLENQTYRLVDTDAARFKPLVGRAVAVTGELLTSDSKAPARGADARTTAPPFERFRVKQVKQVAESCTAIIRAK